MPLAAKVFAPPQSLIELGRTCGSVTPAELMRRLRALDMAGCAA
jgi:hypothetical protein